MRAARRPVAGEPLPGIAAQFPTVCGRCDGLIGINDRIVFARGRAIHVGCASGSNDE